MPRRLLKIAGFGLGVMMLALGGGALWVQASPIPRYSVEKIDLHVEVTPERVARGKKLATVLCALCHMDPSTRKLTGKQLLDSAPAFGVIFSKNITRHPTRGIGSWSDGELAYLLRTGVSRDGQYLPPWMVKLPHVADEDLASIIAFLRSDDPMVAAADVPPPGVSQPGFLTKLLCRIAWKKLPYPKQPIPMPPAGDRVAQGRYLVAALDCYACHSADFKTVTIAEPERSQRYLGGGNPLIDLRGQTIWTANLTPDDDTGIGKWSEADFLRAVRKGFRPDGTPLRYPMAPMPELDEGEVGAIYAYLRTVPKIHNRVRREMAATDASSQGRTIYYKYACVSCHGDNGVGIADLRQAAQHYPERKQLEAWIRNASAIKPGTKMPTWDGVIADGEYAPLISYVLELGK
jgi:mono/diheme cytochrome c family protein